MKFALVILVAIGLHLAGSTAFAQKSPTPTPPPPPPVVSAPTAPAPLPQLSTADQIAITYFEDQKKSAKDKFSEAQQGLDRIRLEYAQSHPGFQVNPATYAVEALPKPAPAKPVK